MAQDKTDTSGGEAGRGDAETQLRAHLEAAAGESKAAYDNLVKSYLSGRMPRQELDAQVAPLVGAYNMEAHARFLNGLILLVHAKRRLASSRCTRAVTPPLPAGCTVAGPQAAVSALPASASTHAAHGGASVIGVKRPAAGPPIAASPCDDDEQPAPPKRVVASHTAVGAPVHLGTWRGDVFPVPLVVPAAMTQLRAAAAAAVLARVDAAAAELTAQAAQQYITAVMRHVEGMSWLGGAPAGPPPPLLGDPSRLRLAERIAVLAGAHAAAWGEHGHGRGDFSAGGQRPAAQ